MSALRSIDMGYTSRDNLAAVKDQLDALRNESFTYSSRELLALGNGAYSPMMQWATAPLVPALWLP